MDFLMRLFSRGQESKNIAKERLRLVLIQDRSSMSPELMEQLKNELIAVISKYVEIDTEEIDVSLNREDNSVALVANIPVKQIKRQ